MLDKKACRITPEISGRAAIRWIDLLGRWPGGNDMACDICGAKVEYTEALRDTYQTDEIKSLCPDCMQVAEKELRKLETWLHRVKRELLKRVLRQRQESFLRPNDMVSGGGTPSA
jgi:hypothetical protein